MRVFRSCQQNYSHFCILAIALVLALLTTSDVSAQSSNSTSGGNPLPPQENPQWQLENGQVVAPSRVAPISNARPLPLPANPQLQNPQPKVVRSVLETNSQLNGNLQANRIPVVPQVPFALRDASFGDPNYRPSNSATVSNAQTILRTGLIVGPQQENASQPSAAPIQQELVPATSPSTANTTDASSSTNTNQIVDSSITTVTRGMQQLPNDAGQVWRTYDLTPYTNAIQATAQLPRPEQAVVDWILKETGTEVWFSQPMGILSVDRAKLHVYHTPAMQSRIKPIVDRFIQGRGKTQVVGLKLMTITSPNWRSTAFAMMQPVPVSATGVEAWLMSKENAAILSNQLRNRADYQPQSIGDLVISDGQRYTLAKKRPVNFLRSVQLVQNNGFAQYQPIQDQIEEGYGIDFSALSSLDGRSIEAIVGCDINQIEKMQRVTVDLPTAGGQTQPVDLQIPQMVSWKVRERFRWPADQVLVVSCGVVATPGPQRQALLGIPSLFNGTRGRADALMFIEYKGLAPKNAGLAGPVVGQAQAAPSNSQGGAGWTGRPAVGQNGLSPVTPRR